MVQLNKQVAEMYEMDLDREKARVFYSEAADLFATDVRVQCSLLTLI